ncbi:MAG TPA: type II toxin-antitoxin system VapC family toxin [Chloroflexota bacterium]|nr:type II toxin-antitoxin system VapC family toxin [Chloroflexota bacterium]
MHFEQLTRSQGQQALAEIAAMGVDLIAPDGAQTRHAFDWTIRLKRAPAYDSYYLALAETLGCDLWTADRRLVNAVNLPWVRMVDPGA